MFAITHILPRCALLGLVLFACHDAPRKNPFDPALTPPVDLSIAVDDTSGTATLTWTPYSGDTPFAYWVLRKVQGLEAVDTLAVLSEGSQITFVDSSLAPNTDYVYQVSVINTSGFEVASPQQSIVGARFAAYRIERRTSDEDFAAIHRLDASADTTFTDTGLQPEQTYFYRIVVEAAGREWTSNRSGRLGFSLAPVQLLTANADETAGTVALSWSRFAGPDFQAYRVQRRVVGTDEEVVLAEQTDRPRAMKRRWARR